MNDTSKDAIERFDYCIHESDMLMFDTGKFVRFTDYAALSAQLEIANAQAARARDDALGEAAKIVTYLSQVSGRNQDGDFYVGEEAANFAGSVCDEAVSAIHALRTQPPPAVEPVTVPTTAKIMADERVKALVDASTQFAKAFLDHDDGCGKNFHLTWKERSEAFAKLTHTLAQLKDTKP